MTDYTVILRRPDAITPEWPDDCYVAYVTAEKPFEALRLARIEVCDADRADDLHAEPDDYALVVAFEGHAPIALWWLDHKPTNPASPSATS